MLTRLIYSGLAGLVLALLVIAPMAHGQGAVRPDARDDSDISVRAEKDGENIIIDVAMPVQASLAAVWDVFTDYDHMAQFVTAVHASRITDRNGNILLVAQKSSTEFGLIKFSFENVRQVELIPRTEIRSRLISGDMKDSAFTTRLVSDGGGVTRIFNHGVFIPTMWVPPILGTAFLESETRRQFAELRSEILRRSSAEAVKTPTQ
jgi:Polyketide cyclase / dehydrase and lipid transport